MVNGSGLYVAHPVTHHFLEQYGADAACHKSNGPSAAEFRKIMSVISSYVIWSTKVAQSQWKPEGLRRTCVEPVVVEHFNILTKPSESLQNIYWLFSYVLWWYFNIILDNRWVSNKLQYIFWTNDYQDLRMISSYLRENDRDIYVTNACIRQLKCSISHDSNINECNDNHIAF